MIKELYFFLYTIKKKMQNSAELRTSFLMNILGMALNNTAFIILWIFFVKSVGTINGWTTADIIGLLGFSALSYGLVFSFGAGINKITDYVTTGTFDQFMLSPKNLIIRTATSFFSSSTIGDIFFGIACLIIYGILTKITLIQVLLMIFLVLFSTIIFFSATLMIQSLAFFFIEAYSITEGIFELFLSPSLFHGGAFQGLLRFFFVFIIPSLLLGALPVETIKNISLKNFIIIGTLSVIWLILSIKIFNKAVKSYESSNFMTFGN